MRDTRGHASRTKDRAWYLIQVSHTKGWVEASRIAAASKQEVLHFVRSNPLVMTGPRVEIYSDPSLSHHAAHTSDGRNTPP